MELDDYQLKMETLRMIREYNLHESGMTYVQQGFVNADGQVWAWKMDEHLLVSGFFNEARKIKYGW